MNSGLFAQPSELPGEEPSQARGAARHHVDHQNQDNPVDRPAKPLDTCSAILGTNRTNSPPTRVPGIEPTPPTIKPTNSAIDRKNVKLSGATNCTTIAPIAPATPV